MKKQAYSEPQMQVVLLQTSASVLLSASDINSINNNVGLEWDENPDNTGEPI